MAWDVCFKTGGLAANLQLASFLEKSRQRISWCFKGTTEELVKIKVWDEFIRSSQLKQKSLNVSRSVFFRGFHSVPILVEPLIYLLKMPWVAWSAIIWSQKGGKVLLFFGVCRGEIYFPRSKILTWKNRGGCFLFASFRNKTRWWFQIFFILNPTWGNDPIWLIFFRWVETTN